MATASLPPKLTAGELTDEATLPYYWRWRRQLAHGGGHVFECYLIAQPDFES
jgi:hypothetical protein